MKTSTKMLMYIIMISSTILVLSSSNWINMWMGMEINLMSFIPIMFENKNNFLSQSCMSYFLIQSMASIMFLMFIILMMLKQLEMQEITKMMIISSMMMKLGMPPFHSWFPEVINKLKWSACFMMMTWQKIAPLFIMSQIISMNTLTYVIIITSTLAGGILGINQTSTRKIMAYSSINHLGWMLSCMLLNKKSWMLYLMMYTLLVMMMCMMFSYMNILYINQSNLQSMKMSDKIIMLSMMLSMGGLPPMLGFMPKWTAILYMMESKEIMIMLMMVTSSLISLIYYLRLMMPINLNMSISQKWMMLNSTKSTYMISMFMLNMTLPMLIMLIKF